MHLYPDNDFLMFFKYLQDPMAVYAAPGGNITLRTRISASHDQNIPIFECLDLVLCANHR